MECGVVCGDYKLYNTILQQFAVKQFLRPFKVVFPILVYGESGLSHFLAIMLNMLLCHTWKEGKPDGTNVWWSRCLIHGLLTLTALLFFACVDVVSDACVLDRNCCVPISACVPGVAHPLSRG